MINLTNATRVVFPVLLSHQFEHPWGTSINHFYIFLSSKHSSTTITPWKINMEPPNKWRFTPKSCWFASPKLSFCKFSDFLVPCWFSGGVLHHGLSFRGTPCSSPLSSSPPSTPGSFPPPWACHSQGGSARHQGRSNPPPCAVVEALEKLTPPKTCNMASRKIAIFNRRYTPWN